MQATEAEKKGDTPNIAMHCCAVTELRSVAQIGWRSTFLRPDAGSVSGAFFRLHVTDVVCNAYIPGVLGVCGR